VRVARLLITLVVFVAIGAGVAFAVVRLAGGTPSGYLVRAIFDNSSFVTPGEEVKVAGVTVGTIHAVQLTPQNKSALVLSITNRGFQPFRTDAHCEIGLESLLGEQFVQCTPTQPRPPGAPAPPPLKAIASGPNKGQHVLPVQNTTTPVGFDLLQDMMRLPEQERLRLIITGLGAGLDANGQDLNAALKRADPALEQTDQVIAVLARQDRILADLTDESARVLAPLAAQRQHIGGFIRHAGAVAVASGQESQAIQQNLRDLPPFLRQLEPYSARLTNLAAQMTPSLQTLQSYAPQINSAVSGLGPLASASIPALQTLGNVAARGERVFPRAHRVVAQLLALAKPLLPLARDIAGVATSFDNTGGIEDVMRFIYYYAGSVNGEDALGHFIRSLVTIVPPGRTSTPTRGQGTANFTCEIHPGRCKGSGGARATPIQPATAPGGARATPTQQTTASANATEQATARATTLLRYLLKP
jgi:phospholipid/cholesterol/gamma-HCH transport system substrate-binding protein